MQIQGELRQLENPNAAEQPRPRQSAPWSSRATARGAGGAGRGSVYKSAGRVGDGGAPRRALASFCIATLASPPDGSVLERVDAAYMLWCGLLQDWKASVGWSLALWALPLALLREAATAAALVHLVIDFGLQSYAPDHAKV